MGKETRKVIRNLGDLVELVVKAMFSIVIVYLIAKALIETIAGEQAAKVISAILGIGGLFIVIVSKKVREEILKFGKKNEKR